MAGLIQSNTLESLPLYQLFNVPFKAAADAQKSLALSTAAFVKKYAMDPSGNIYMNTLTTYFDIPMNSVTDLSMGYLLDMSGGGVFGPKRISRNSPITPGGPLVTNHFTADDDQGKDAGGTETSGFKKRVGNRVFLLDGDGKVKYVQGMRSITVPFISLLNIPSLCIDEVKVDFSITIKSQVLASDSNTFSNTFNEIDSKAGYYDRGFDIQNTYTTAVSTSAAKTASDDSTESTYKVMMKAKQFDPPGLVAILNFITNNKDTSSRKVLDLSGNAQSDPSTMKSNK